MTQNEFYELKERAAESQLPFKLVDRAAIKYIGRFEDNGKPYDPTTAKEPDITLSAEERDIGGLGIFMVKKMAADIQYENAKGKNKLTVVFDVKLGDV